MQNSVTVEIRFSFKGERYAPSAVIDLDSYLEKGQTIPAFFHLVASQNQIDVYSYQYEVMEMSQTVYSNATGLAAEFCQADHFDVQGFSEKWKEIKLLQQLSDIAREHLHIDDLEQHEEIKSALLAAYRLAL
jgi:hypothetical protein